MSEEKHWRVDVFHDYKHLLTIEKDSLCGKSEISDEENDAIYKCGEHLISFARKPKDMPEPRTDYAVFGTLDRLFRSGHYIWHAVPNGMFYLSNAGGGTVMTGSSFRDLCVNIVLAGL